METSLIGFLVSTVVAASCASTSNSRTFVRYGLELQVPADWRDSHGTEEMKLIGFRDSTGQIGFGVERFPGQWDKYLSYEREARVPERKEEEIHSFGRFAGKGYRFVATDKGSSSESVFFAPSGELDGWFMIVSSSSKDRKLQEELLTVVNSLRKVK